MVLETDDIELRSHFRPLNWFRWYTARKYLEYYDYLWVVDPDMFVVPSCWGPVAASGTQSVCKRNITHLPRLEWGSPPILSRKDTEKCLKFVYTTPCDHRQVRWRLIPACHRTQVRISARCSRNARTCSCATSSRPAR